MTEIQRVVGLMSGTSLDGIDAALLETDGETVARPGEALTVPYAPELRARLRAILDQAWRGEIPATSDAEALLTEAHAEAVRMLLKRADLPASAIDLIGFHGQTILHRPELRRTWQLGDGAALARATGIAVVNDFRSADVAAGGQGAPFMPLYHTMLAKPLDKPVAVVNVGGVANVTFIGSDDSLLAFDTGPGNAPLDDWAHRHVGEPVDRHGGLARAGRVDEAVLASLLEHPFFQRSAPKSLDRLAFGADMVKHLAPADGAATLTAFTAASIARAPEHFPAAPRLWVICGGGRHNPALMAELRRRLEAPVWTAEDAGWHGDFLEAEGFAYLAARSARNLPLSFPATTGVPYPMPGGRLHKAI